MKKMALLTVVLAAAASAPGQGWEGDLLSAQGDLHGMVGVVFDTEYVWRGFRVFGNKPAVHVLGDLNLFETGFGISAAGHIPTSNDYENWQRLDFTGYYQNGLFAGERYATNFRLGWVYYNYTSMSRDYFDLQEAQAILSWPNLLPVKGLCPSYVAIKLWPASGYDDGSYIAAHASRRGSASGWMHIFMLDYGFTVPGVIPQIEEHLIRLHGEVVYNGGVTPLAQRMNETWTHAVFGVSTDVDLGHNLTLTPAVYYQIAMERGLEEINDDSDSEFWASLGLKYSF
jgi:hypothetical protein